MSGPDDDLTTLIGHRVRALREGADMTQEDLAQVVKLTRSSIANLESGRQNVPVKVLQVLARHFGVSISALIGEGELPRLPVVSIVTTRMVVCEQCGALPYAGEMTASDAIKNRHGHIQTHLEDARR